MSRIRDKLSPEDCAAYRRDDLERNHTPDWRQSRLIRSLGTTVIVASLALLFYENCRGKGGLVPQATQTAQPVAPRP